MPEKSPAPACRCHTVNHLNGAELLALNAVRAWLAAGPHWKHCAASAEAVFGHESGGRFALAMDCLMWVLNRCGLRTMRFGSPHCTRLWPDEMGLLAVMDLAQQGDRNTAARLLLDILPPTAAGVAADYAGAAGAVLAEQDLRLKRGDQSGAQPRKTRPHRAPCCCTRPPSRAPVPSRRRRQPPDRATRPAARGHETRHARPRHRARNSKPGS